MRGKRILIAIALASATCLPAHAGDSGWQSVGRVESLTRAAKSKSEIVVSFQCRNASSNPALMKLEARIVTKPNSDKRDWVLLAAKYNFNPGANPSEWSNWRKVSSNVLKSASGQPTYCSLFHNKKAGTVQASFPPISRKTASGYQTIN